MTPRVAAVALVCGIAVSGVACSGTADDLGSGAGGGAPDGLENALVAATADLGLESLSSALADIDQSELSAGDYTFFAPNDDAFAQLSADELADLLADPEALIETMRNHLVPQVLSAEELADQTEIRSARGSTLEIGRRDGTLTVGGAAVVDSDVALSDGGIVHVIDALLLPE